MSNHESKSKKRKNFWLQFGFYLLLFALINVIAKGLFYFSVYERPLSSSELQFGTSLGFAFGFSVWGNDSLALWKKCLGSVFLILIGAPLSILIWELVPPFVLQFWQWGMLVMIGGLSLAIFYRRFKAYLK
ncbi:hypothetical protein ACM0P9_06605 [Streptococcus pluranimalium]